MNPFKEFVSDLQALSDAMKLAVECIDIAVLSNDISPTDIDHIDKDIVAVRTSMERVNKHIIIQQVAIDLLQT